MSIWDIRFSPKLSFDEALKVFALDEWKTIKGAHVEIGEGGEILHGMGGKFKSINDVPRKTIKQRKGESMEQTKARAEKEFAKQDAAKAPKQETDEERSERLRKTPIDDWSQEDLDFMNVIDTPWGLMGPAARWRKAMEMDEEGKAGLEWLARIERPRLERMGLVPKTVTSPTGKSREWLLKRGYDPDYEDHFSAKQKTLDRIEHLPKAERAKLEKEREEREFADWRGHIAYIENDYIDKQVSSGAMSKFTGDAIKASVSAVGERFSFNRPGQIEVKFNKGTPGKNTVTEWVPKKYLVSEEEVKKYS